MGNFLQPCSIVQCDVVGLNYGLDLHAEVMERQWASELRISLREWLKRGMLESKLDMGEG